MPLSYDDAILNKCEFWLITGLGLSGPVLLQQILRAMEGPNSRRRDAATFALLTLVLQLLAMQCGIFSLWYSRRCYERSRGEMITMIFEKTLARKIIGAPKQPELEEQHSNGIADGVRNGPMRSKFHPFYMGAQLYSKVKRLFGSRAKSEVAKEPASMGKILNLMRYVCKVGKIFYGLLNIQ